MLIQVDLGGVLVLPKWIPLRLSVKSLSAIVGWICKTWFSFKWLELRVLYSLSLLWLLMHFLIYAHKCLYTFCKVCVLVHWQHISASCCVYLSRLREGSLRLKHIKVSKAFLWVGVLQSKAAACCSGMCSDLGNAAWRMWGLLEGDSLGQWIWVKTADGLAVAAALLLVL